MDNVNVLKEDIKHLESENDYLEKQVEVLKNKMDILEDDFDDLNLQLEEYKSKCADLEYYLDEAEKNGSEEMQTFERTIRQLLIDKRHCNPEVFEVRLKDFFWEVLDDKV